MLRDDVTGRDAHGTRVQVKGFTIASRGPVSLRFVNPEPGLTRIDLPHVLARETVTIPAKATGPLGVDFDVTFLPRPGTNVLTADRAIDVEITAGAQTFIDRIFPDLRGQRMRYRFIPAAEADPGLLYCPPYGELVARDANGNCPNHPETNHGSPGVRLVVP